MIIENWLLRIENQQNAQYTITNFQFSKFKPIYHLEYPVNTPLPGNFASFIHNTLPPLIALK